MNTIKGILFDLDQTLVDRSQSLQKFLTWQWHECTPLQAMPFNIFQEKFTTLDDNGKLWKKDVYDKLLNDLSIDHISPDLLEKSYITNFSDHAILFPDVIETLNSFKRNQVKLGIITNGRKDLQSAVIKNCHLHNIMDVVLISETEKIKKPDPHIFETALSNLGLVNQSCAFIGDNPYADIFGANKVGMKTVWKKNNLFPLPDKSITSATFEEFIELSQIISSLGKTY
ncbi:HAD family hydrolase [Kiloniella sp. EL199]|uniref:HAD family hydrolase n=1 Tax=Kiloniella sp. EL199 TaxID=2107581 RepID=UPI000EA192D8|nr:HAD-IIIA family hydrolase [Kiloniella sp. EL199]